MTFNPHFLSMTFETYYEWIHRFRSLDFSILIFWVWPLKQKVYWYGPTKMMHLFNPHFLSMIFETTLPEWHSIDYAIFQSSFSEYDLWNKPMVVEKQTEIPFQSSFSESFLKCNCKQWRHYRSWFLILILWASIET